MKNYSKLKRGLERRASFLSFGNKDQRREEDYSEEQCQSLDHGCAAELEEIGGVQGGACSMYIEHCGVADSTAAATTGEDYAQAWMDTSGINYDVSSNSGGAIYTRSFGQNDPCKYPCDNCYVDKKGDIHCSACDFCTLRTRSLKASEQNGPAPPAPSEAQKEVREMPYYGAIKNSAYNYTCPTTESVGCLTDAGGLVNDDSSVCTVGSFLYCRDSLGNMKPQYGSTETAKYRALHHQDASEALQAWAERIRARSIASEYGKICTKVGNQVDDCYSRGKVSFTNCSHKALMWEDLHSNPILKYFVGATWGSSGSAQNYPDNSTSLKIEGAFASLNKNPMGLGYLKIPTTSESDPSLTYTDRVESNYTYEPKEIDGEYIYMLIARKFTSAESFEIFQALTQQGTAVPQTKLRNGFNFIFTPQGHISFRIGNQPQKTYHNPYIHSHDNSDTNLSIATISSGNSREKEMTMSSDDAWYGIKSFSAANSHKKATIVYGHSAKVVMNRTSTYILYTPADDEKISSDLTPSDEKENLIKTNGYYLLYNPMHQKDFKKFYQAHIRIGPGSEGTPSSGHVYKTAHMGAYGSKSAHLAPPNGCTGSHYEVPSYKTIVSRYCNAFQMKGMKTFFGPHAYVKHYADPLCAFIQNEQLARTSFAQNLNITPKTLTEVHYLNIPTTNPTTENAINRYIYETDKRGSYFNSMSWGCKEHGADDSANSPTIYQWMAGGQYGRSGDGGMLGPRSTSFIKEFVTAMLQGEGDTFITPTDNHQGIGRRPSAADNVDQSVAPTCKPRTQTHVTCNQFVSASGDISSVANVQYMTCGSDPGSDWEAQKKKCPDDCTTGACSDSNSCTKDYLPWHPCKRLSVVPKCNNYDEDEGTPARWSQQGSRGKRWTACCLTKGGFDYIDCQNPLSNGECEARENVEDIYSLDVWDASNKPRFIDDFELKLEGLKDDLDRLGKTALTFKTSYPKDPSIVEKAEEIEDAVKPAKAEVNRLKNLSMKTWVNKFNVDFKNADEAAGMVATNINDMEDKLKFLTSLVNANYIRGIKKKNLYIAAVAFTLIILLIILI